MSLEFHFFYNVFHQLFPIIKKFTGNFLTLNIKNQTITKNYPDVDD